MEPTILSRYRPAIVDGLQRALAGDGPLRGVLRYHVGLEDESGTPAQPRGKLIRPSLALRIAEELAENPEVVLSAAVSLELVHEFSLIHDDVQDTDEMRRGRPTVWSRWGKPQAINAGDLMLSVALVEARPAGGEVLGRILDAVIEMVEGQALDVWFETRWPSMEEYTAMIDRKTGALFCCACELGAIIAGAPPGMRDRLIGIGREFGRAYQIRDDLLGIWGSESKLGRPIGADLRRGKKSYPVVAAAAKAGRRDRRALSEALTVERLSDAAVDRIITMMGRLGIPEDGAHEVSEHLERIVTKLEGLPLSEAGVGELTAMCESLRWAPEQGAR